MNAWSKRQLQHSVSSSRTQSCRWGVSSFLFLPYSFWALILQDVCNFRSRKETTVLWSSCRSSLCWPSKLGEHYNLKGMQMQGGETPADRIFPLCWILLRRESCCCASFPFLLWNMVGEGYYTAGSSPENLGIAFQCKKKYKSTEVLKLLKLLYLYCRVK